MSATPTYDRVVEQLRIDPERIAARPAWSLQAAERRREHSEDVPPRTVGEPSAQRPGATQVLQQQTLARPSHPPQNTVTA